MNVFRMMERVVIRTIITDCDGVLVDWRAGYNSWMVSEGYRLVDDSHDPRYDMTTAFPDLSAQQILDEMARFNHAVEFSRLPFYEDVEAGVAALKAHLPAADLLVMTAIGYSERKHELRTMNLSPLGISELRLVEPWVSKLPRLREVGGPAIFIEDSFDQALAGVEAGHETFLITRPWNIGKDHAAVTRVSGWAELVGEVRDRYPSVEVVGA